MKFIGVSLASQLLRKGLVYLSIGCSTHEVVERCRLCRSGCADENGVVFGVRIGVADQDVEDHRIKKFQSLRWGDTGSQCFEHLRQGCAAAATQSGLFVFLCRKETQQLARVFLVDASDCSLVVGDPVIALHLKIIPLSSARDHYTGNV